MLYDCCHVYVNRFWRPKRSVLFSVWDKDQNTDDDFIGFATLPASEVPEANGKVGLQDFLGHEVQSGMISFFAKRAQLWSSVTPVALPEPSRLEACVAARVRRGGAAPRGVFL